jgi:hypothetical protein
MVPYPVPVVCLVLGAWCWEETWVERVKLGEREERGGTENGGGALGQNRGILIFVTIPGTPNCSTYRQVFVYHEIL